MADFTARSGLTPRQLSVRAHIDISHGRGLELGPLVDPLVTREEANIQYLDVMTTENLRHHYRDDPSLEPAKIVEIDFALIGNDGAVHSISDAVGSAAPFDWAVASHVIEHVPDMIGWLADLAEVMSDGGRLSLVVPDRRFTFDAARPPTSVGDLLMAHYEGDTRPSIRALYEYFALVCHVNSAELWNGFVPGKERRMRPLTDIPAILERSIGGEYIDSHVWVFTPSEFVEQLDELSRLGLIDFAFVNLTATARGTIEFYVTLERLPRHVDEVEKREIFIAGATEAAAKTLLGDIPVPPFFSTSSKEQRIIEAKRALLLLARQLAAKPRDILKKRRRH